MIKNFSEKLKTLENWNAPENWLRIKTIDAHTAGEPLRIILSGLPELKGNTILAKRRYMKDNFDYLRTGLMFEPRGHADMYGCIITEPVTAGADFGVVFIHNEGYSTMCGHGIIAITKAVLQTGMFPIVEPVTKIKIDTPAGLVTSFARIENGKIKSVFFHNVPSFVLTLDQMVDVPGIGKVKYDIAFGGAFYIFVNAEDIGLKLTHDYFRLLIEKGMDIKRAVMQSYPIIHPFEEDFNFLYGTIFLGPPESEGSDSRNVCIFAEGEVDRSPTGTGVSARMAIHFARGEIKLNESMVIESIINSKFTGSVVSATTFGSHNAVIPQVEGNAFITGKNEFIIDPDDPLKNGFILR